MRIERLSDLLREATADDPEGPTTINRPKWGRPMEQADAIQMLRDAREALMVEHTFKPGDIVRFKRGIESGTKELRGGVMIYLTDVDFSAFPPPRDWNSSLFNSYTHNCVCGLLGAEGAMMMFTFDSSCLEPVPGTEA